VEHLHWAQDVVIQGEHEGKHKGKHEGNEGHTKGIALGINGITSGTHD